MKVLVTGSSGFIGKNLCERLSLIPDISIIPFDKDDKIEDIKDVLPSIDFIFHLAGVNRPQKNEEFFTGNRDLISQITDIILEKNLSIPILVTSSMQAEFDNDYGLSKKQGEDVLRNYSKLSGAKIYIYRLSNVFGKWCNPNYNSVVATWCYNLNRNLPVEVSDSSKLINFVYIDDVVTAIACHIIKNEQSGMSVFLGDDYYSVGISYNKTLGELKVLLESIKNNRKSLVVPEVGSGFARAVYATYLSYAPEDSFDYDLQEYVDERGSFVEIIKTAGNGQFSVSYSKPGVVRGHHYHNTKCEKFLVVQGEALVIFKHIITGEIIEYRVSSKKKKVIDIPVGYSHSITNVGDCEMILFIWASEVFDKNNPDTNFLETR